MSVRRTAFRFLALAAIFGMILVPSAGWAVSGPEVKIAALLPFSGPVATLGLQQREALAIALEEINAAGGVGGVPIKLIIYDTAGKNEQAILSLRKAIEQDNVIAVLGPFLSSEAQVAFPVANRAGVPIISASSAAPGIAAANRPWTFRLSVPSNIVYEPEIATWKEFFPDVKKVIIFTDQKDFFSHSNGTKVYPPILKKNGYEILDTLTYQTGDIDFSAQVTKARALNPDGVVIAGLINEGGNIIREMRRQGMAQPVVGGYDLAQKRLFEIAGDKAVEGMVGGTDFWEERPDPKTRKFVDQIKKRIGDQKIHNVTASMYDTIYIMRYAMEKGGISNKPEEMKEDREKIRKVLEGLKDYEGVSGKISFNQEGDPVKETFVLQVKGGKFVRVR